MPTIKIKDENNNWVKLPIAKGETGPRGPQGPQGEKGADGTGISVLGKYATLEELQTAHPTGNVGDAYMIDTNMYIWVVESQTWVDVGSIQGPQGISGIVSQADEPTDKNIIVWVDTDADGTVLDISTYENKVESISVNGEKQPITNKNVDITVPTELSEIVVSATEPTGDNREKVWIQKGKNLLDIKEHFVGAYLNETTGDFTSQTSSEISSNTNVGHVTNKIPCLGNTTYIISGEHNRNRWIEYYADGSHSTPKYATSFTTTAKAKYIQCYFYAGASNISSLKIQIEQGSTATAYEPYVEPRVYIKNDNDIYEEFKQPEVSVGPVQPCNGEKVWMQKGKNLFDIDTMVEFKGKYRLWDTGWYVNENADYNGIKFPVKPNTSYAFSTDATAHTSIAFYDKNLNYITGNVFTNGTVFETPENCYIVTMAVKNDYTWIQVEQSTTATEYEEYIEPKIYVKNDNDVYEEFVNISELENRITQLEELVYSMQTALE